MSVRSKFFLIFFSVFLILSLLIVFYFNYSQNRDIKQLEYHGNALKKLLNTSINLYNITYENMANDYTFWDDMVEYVNGKKSKKWEDENLKILFKSFKINAVWIYDKDKKLKYYADNLKKDTAFTDLKLNDFNWNEFKQKRGITFQTKIGNNYCFVFGKTIHSTYDYEREKEPSGYFIIAKSIDNEVLKYYNSLCGCELKIINDSIYPDEYSLADATYSSSFALNNQNGNLLGSLKAPKKSIFLSNLHRQNNYTIYFLSFFGTVVLALILIGFYYLVNKPLELFSQAIIDKDEEKINKLSQKNDEFGKLGFLLKEFIYQQKHLETEIMKRKQADESLSELNSMYKSLFDDSSVAICFSKEQKILKVNQAFLDLFKYQSFSELDDLNIIDLIFEDDRPFMYDRYYRIENGFHVSDNYDIRVVCSDGEIREVNFKSKIFEINNQKYNLTILLDITEKKLFEREVIREKAYFENIFQKSPEAIAMLDNNGVVIKINNAFTKLFGYTPEEAIGKTTKELIEPKELFGEINSLISRVVSGETIYYETVRVSKSNDYIDVSITATPIEFFTNKTGIYAIYRDVRDRVLYNKEIKKKGELFKALANAQQSLLNVNNENYSIPNYLKIIGESLNIVRVRIFKADIINEEKSLNIIADWISDNNFFNPMKEEDDLIKLFIKWTDNFNTIKIVDKQSNSSQLTDKEILMKYGIEAIAAAPIFVRNSLMGFIIFEDYESDIQWTDTELSILNISATSIGNYYESRLYEEELIKAREKAEESDKLKTNFISNMSHELRTPLNGILGFTELLKEELVNEDHKNMLDVINISSLRLLNTLNSIIDFTLLSSYKIFINKTVVDIDEVINNKVSIFNIDIERKRIKFQYKPKTKIRILTDVDYFGRIINALIDNAIKFTKEGGIIIESEVIINNNEETFAQIKIIDTGIGIAKEHFDLIFEPFRQVSEGLSREYEGNGLGLTVCKKYIDLLGGKIELESEIGKGTTFSLIFPEVVSSSINHHNNVRIDNTKPLILLVEDEVSSREFANVILSGKYSLHTAINADNAIIKAYEYRYDAILMDISLGMGKNGVEVAKIIRSISGYDKVPIAAVTANAMIEHMEYYLNNGFTHYIAKPYSKDTLINLIEQMLSKIEY